MTQTITFTVTQKHIDMFCEWYENRPGYGEHRPKELGFISTNCAVALAVNEQYPSQSKFKRVWAVAGSDHLVIHTNENYDYDGTELEIIQLPVELKQFIQDIDELMHSKQFDSLHLPRIFEVSVS